MLIQISNLNTMPKVYPAGNLKQNVIESCAFSKSFYEMAVKNILAFV